MDIKGMTLGKALRMRSTLANKISVASTRAVANAVSLENKTETDFNTTEQLAEFSKRQRELRELKLRVSVKSLNTKVTIPDEIPVEEAGCDVPLMGAVLIRDDLKSRKVLLDKIIESPTHNHMDYSGESPKEIKRIRNFDFNEAIKMSEMLQEAIDTMDGIIQGTDAVVKFE